MQVCNRQDLLSRTDLFTYVYAETSSSRKQGDLFTLTYDGSACSNIGLSVSTVTFHYHMYGATIGTLGVTNAAGPPPDDKCAGNADKTRCKIEKTKCDRNAKTMKKCKKQCKKDNKKKKLCEKTCCELGF